MTNIIPLALTINVVNADSILVEKNRGQITHDEVWVDVVGGKLLPTQKGVVALFYPPQRRGAKKQSQSQSPLAGKMSDGW